MMDNDPNSLALPKLVTVPHLAPAMIGKSPYEGITLDVIVAVKINADREELLNRITYCMDDQDLPEGVNVIIADDGSPDKYYQHLKENKPENYKLIRTGAHENDDFCLARARNIGAQHSDAEFIMFMDADLIPYDGFYKDLYKELTVLNMQQHINRFLMVPVIYLKQESTEEFFTIHREIRREYFINYMLAADKQKIEKYSSGTSVVLLNRLYFLSLGGQDETFKGWGYEDYEFNNRLIRRFQLYPLPSNWMNMAENFMNVSTYQGWKATYRLYGDWLANKGVYLFHIPHDIDTAFHDLKEKNWAYLETSMRKDQSGTQITKPLIAPQNCATLIIGKNIHIKNNILHSLLGNIIDADISQFQTTVEFEKHLDHKNITRIIFHAPYGQGLTSPLYQWCREHQKNITVTGKGALPNTVYFDPSGHPNDSDQYKVGNWDTDLTEDQTASVEAYIEKTKKHLKKNNTSPEAIRTAHDILPAQKVVIVPFQDPKDINVLYFSGDCHDFESFIARLETLAKDLPDDHILALDARYRDHLNKTHNTIFFPEHAFYDLLEISNSVLTLNAPSGIDAMIFGKHLFVLGQAWYRHDGLCTHISKDMPIAHIATYKEEINTTKRNRFIYYLRFKFYSVYDPEASTASTTYKELQFPGKPRMIFEMGPYVDDKKSPLFARYHQTNWAPLPVTRWERIKNDPKLFFKNTKILPLRPLHYFFAELK